MEEHVDGLRRVVSFPEDMDEIVRQIADLGNFAAGKILETRRENQRLLNEIEQKTRN